MKALPMACSLESGDLQRRIRAIESIGGAWLRSLELSDGRAVLRFEPAARDALADIVAAEAECCPVLGLSMSDEPDGLVLTVEAPADAAAVLVDYVSRFRAGIRSSVVE
jgi:hypothetical protein